MNFPHLLPKSVLNTISPDSASTTVNMNDQECYLSTWFRHYNTTIFRTSVFFKGPILFKNFHDNADNNWIAFNNVKKFKTNVKNYVVRDVQCTGGEINSNTWIQENFPLHTIPGLRFSSRLREKPKVCYRENSASDE